MKGSALRPENWEKVKEARVILTELKNKKLLVRAEKYANSEDGLPEFLKHLAGEVEEAYEEYFDFPVFAINYQALALEIADISNCCDLIIAEIASSLKTPALSQAQTVTPENEK